MTTEEDPGRRYKHAVSASGLLILVFFSLVLLVIFPETSRSVIARSAILCSPRLSADVRVEFGRAAPDGCARTTSGWSGREEAFVWSIGEESQLLLWMPLTASQQEATVLLLVGGFPSPTTGTQGLTVYRGRRLILEQEFGWEATPIAVPITRRWPWIPQPFPVVLRLEHASPTRPCEVSGSNDCRQLSVRLYSVELDGGSALVPRSQVG